MLGGTICQCRGNRQGVTYDGRSCRSHKYNLKGHPNYRVVEENGGKPFDYDRRAQMSFKSFMEDVKEVKTVKIDGDEGDI